MLSDPEPPYPKGWETPHLTMPVSERDHIQGPATAAVTLVEYGDYECPYCSLAYPVVKEIQQRAAACGEKSLYLGLNRERVHLATRVKGTCYVDQDVGMLEGLHHNNDRTRPPSTWMVVPVM